MFIKQYVQVQNFATDKTDRLAEKLRQEEGEIASQVIVMAMLVGVAVALVKAGPDLIKKADEVTNAAKN